ncbi:MAG: choloylglycine hydrolase [Clostridia bacterium]|nr:choloylglycine hydrolase [Clostridia bacterium]
MCTALRFTAYNNYFGRNLDLDISYAEEVCVMPRHFPLIFRKMGEMTKHYGMVGMATVVDGVPLFYDGVNECGLAMAGLAFPENAHYSKVVNGKNNIASFEFIPWILGQAKTVDEAEALLSRINLVNITFNEKLPTTPLHWMIADRNRSIVVEFTKDGMHVYQNKTGVLTNNPPFPYHLKNLENYRHLRNDDKNVERSKITEYSDYSKGLGALGLPGDVSSMSRFVRMAFLSENSVKPNDESSSVGQFFHLLSSVEAVKGACKTETGAFDITAYSSCMNIDKGLYYYTTYSNRRISCVNMHAIDLQSDKISRFPLILDESIKLQN